MSVSDAAIIQRMKEVEGDEEGRLKVVGEIAKELGISRLQAAMLVGQVLNDDPGRTG